MSKFTPVSVTIFATLAFGCSPASGSKSALYVTTTSTTPQVAHVTLEELEVGPLWEVLHRIRLPQGPDNISEADAYSLALGKQVEECMNDHGFEYVNVLWERLRVPLEISILDPTPRQKVAGYGISTHVEHWYRSGLYNANANPNIAILDQLELVEAASWNATLGGSPSSDEPSCIHVAGEDVEWSIDLVTLQSDVRLIEREVHSQPLVKDATLGWSKCMSDAGYIYASPRDILGELEQAAVPLIRHLEALDPRPPSIEDVPADLRANLDELVAHELEVAALDLQCRESHLNWAIQSVQGSVHERFLRANPSLLEYLDNES